MTSEDQKARAVRFRQLHSEPPILILPNAWDAASARIFEQAGFPAIATTSSGVAASLGYPDGQRISREMMLEVVERITRVVSCPVSADIEAGYGSTIAEVLETVKAVINAGAVGINIEDSVREQERSLVDISFQVELLQAIRETASSMDMPLVINARTDVYVLPVGDPASRLVEAVQRANLYRQAGADCLFPIGASDAGTIAALAQAIHGPINVIASARTPSIAELAQLKVARASLASGAMHAVLGYLRQVADELLEHGTYTKMTEGALSGTEFRQLFER